MFLLDSNYIMSGKQEEINNFSNILRFLIYQSNTNWAHFRIFWAKQSTLILQLCTLSEVLTAMNLYL